MRIKAHVALLLVLLLVALCPGTASAHGGLDTGFGRSGIVRFTVPEGEYQTRGFTVGANGRIYGLFGSSLYAFESDGEVAGGSGEGGQVSVEPAVGDASTPLLSLVEEEDRGGPTGFAIDSQGRIVVVGSTYLPSRKADEAYVIRLLPDGRRDESFGDDGEVETDFNLAGAKGFATPNVRGVSIALDAEDRPLVGGSFGNPKKPCAIGFRDEPRPFYGRLSVDGEVDTTFARSGRAILAGRGKVEYLDQIPAAGRGVFVRPCPGSPRPETRPLLFTIFTEDGGKSGVAKGVELPFSYDSPAFDPSGRLFELESPPPVAEGADALVRLRPDGVADTGYGRRGRVFLRRPPYAHAFTLDAAGRPIVAVGGKRTILKRFLRDGRVDPKFGPDGRLTAAAGEPVAISLDAQGRIYTVSLLGGAATTFAIARFVPGD